MVEADGDLGDAAEGANINELGVVKASTGEKQLENEGQL